MHMSISTLLFASIAISLWTSDTNQVLSAIHTKDIPEAVFGCERQYNVQNTSLEIPACTKTELSINSQDEYQKFANMTLKIRGTIISLSISSIDFEIVHLLTLLEGCINLEVFRLDCVSWSDQFVNKVHLPKLKSFTRLWDRRGVWIFHSTGKLTSEIFFYKHQDGNWKEDLELWTEVDFLLGMEDFKPRVELTRDEFTVRDMTDSEFLNHVLRYRTIRKLTLQGIPVTAGELIYLHSMQTVDMQDVYLEEVYASDVLGNCSTAENIRLMFTYKFLHQSVDFGSWIPSTRLKSLQLAGIRFRGSSTEITLDLSKLEIFSLSQCDLIPTLVRFSPFLKSLELSNVNILIGSLGDLFVSQNITLSSLQLWSVVSRRGDFDQPAVLDMSLINTSELQTLAVKNCEIIMSKTVQFPQIKTLRLYNNVLQSEIVRNFSYFFKTVQVISFSDEGEYELDECDTISPTFLLEILNTDMHKLTFKFGWNSDEKGTTEHSEATHFLKCSGVRYLNWRKIRLELPANETRFDIFCPSAWQLFWETDIESFVLGTLVLGVSGFGILGNFISVLVLSRSEMRKFSSTFVLLALAFWDTLFLVTAGLQFICLFYELHIRDGLKEFRYIEEISLFLIYPLNKTAYTGSVYLTLLLTLDRFIAVSMPLRAKTLLNTRRTLKYITVVFVFAVIFNFHRWIEFITWEYSYSRDDTEWDFRMGQDMAFLDEYRVILNLYLWSLIIYIFPFLVMTTLNIKIWLEIRRANTARRGLAGQTRDADISVTKMLISIVVLFLIFNALSALIATGYYMVSHTDTVIIEFATMLPLLLNSAVNFVIYCTMGKKFRVECIQLFCAILKPFKCVSLCGTRSERGATTGTEAINLAERQ